LKQKSIKNKFINQSGLFHAYFDLRAMVEWQEFAKMIYFMLIRLQFRMLPFPLCGFQS